ncbi:MAG: M48 family metallopeptidase [candidate division SR1 bacterium]|nr:M48 family metallopeptidase [candidate division SR1 bacterium]
MEITYKPIRHGYARIDKNGKLLITIPIRKKGTEFEKIMIQKGEALFTRYNKRTHIDPIQKDSILLFGEEVSKTQLMKQHTGTIKNITKEILKDYATPLFDLYSKKLGIPYKNIIFRKTTSKRGSCTHDQKFSLNLDLIHLPTKYIKYVIIHEACHLKIKNHSKKFRTLVESFCPEYKRVKKELSKFNIR